MVWCERGSSTAVSACAVEGKVYSRRWLMVMKGGPGRGGKALFSLTVWNRMRGCMRADYKKKAINLFNGLRPSTRRWWHCFGLLHCNTARVIKVKAMILFVMGESIGICFLLTLCERRKRFFLLSYWTPLRKILKFIQRWSITHRTRRVNYHIHCTVYLQYGDRPCKMKVSLPASPVAVLQCYSIPVLLSAASEQTSATATHSLQLTSGVDPRQASSTCRSHSKRAVKLIQHRLISRVLAIGTSFWHFLRVQCGFMLIVFCKWLQNSCIWSILIS